MAPGRSQLRRTEVRRTLFFYSVSDLRVGLVKLGFFFSILGIIWDGICRGVGLHSAVRLLHRACSFTGLVFFSENGLTFPLLNQIIPLIATMKKKMMIVREILKAKVSVFSQFYSNLCLKSKIGKSGFWVTGIEDAHVDTEGITSLNSQMMYTECVKSSLRLRTRKPKIVKRSSKMASVYFLT